MWIVTRRRPDDTFGGRSAADRGVDVLSIVSMPTGHLPATTHCDRRHGVVLQAGTTAAVQDDPATVTGGRTWRVLLFGQAICPGADAGRGQRRAADRGYIAMLMTMNVFIL